MSEHRSLSPPPRCQWQRMESWLQEKACPAGHMLHVPAHCPGDRGPGLGHVRDKDSQHLPIPVCVCVGAGVCVGGWVGARACALGHSTDRHLCLFHLSMNEGVGPVVCQLSASSPILAQPDGPLPASAVFCSKTHTPSNSHFECDSRVHGDAV